MRLHAQLPVDTFRYLAELCPEEILSCFAIACRDWCFEALRMKAARQQLQVHTFECAVALTAKDCNVFWQDAEAALTQRSLDMQGIISSLHLAFDKVGVALMA